jgi:hypothetical protein
MRGFSVSKAVAIAFAAYLGTAAAAAPGQAQSPPGQLSERAQMAGKFVDSMGINVHLSYRSTGYGQTARITGLLDQLGIMHLRDGVTPGQDDVCRVDRSLAAKGFRFTYITQPNPAAATLEQWAACAGPALEAFEGLNEFDISHPQGVADWATVVRSSQQQLYRAVKGSALLARTPVIGPSLTSEAAFRAVGDVSHDMDVGNMHDYFTFRQPETTGWGDGGYGSLAFNLRLAQFAASAKPIEATETGYGTDRSDHAVDEATQAIYLPRLLLTQFAAGVVRTFIYELIDEGGPPFAHYGIVSDTLVPKPAYTALSSLVGVLRDSNAAFSPKTLRYTIDGADQDVHHLLLQKRDGRFILAVWLGTASCDPDTHAARPVAPRPIRIATAAPLRSAAIYTYGADWRLQRVAAPPQTPLSVSVTDRVTLIELTPLTTAP